MATFRTPLRVGEPEAELLCGKITGTGAATPTISEGCNGFTVSYVGTGTYAIVFDGPVVQAWAPEPGIWADTATDVDGWKIVFGQYVPSTKTLPFKVYDATPSQADLPALTGLYLFILAKHTATRG